MISNTSQTYYWVFIHTAVASTSARRLEKSMSVDTQDSISVHRNPRFTQAVNSGHDQRYFAYKLLGLHTNCTHINLSKTVEKIMLVDTQDSISAHHKPRFTPAVNSGHDKQYISHKLWHMYTNSCLIILSHMCGADNVSGHTVLHVT